MELIIGGSYQGKSAFAQNVYPEIKWLDGRSCSLKEAFSCKGMDHFEIFIKRMLETNGNVDTLAGWLIEKNPEIVLISTEMGYGVVPVNPFDRMYREAVGRVCTELASFSKKVYRVVCGIGTVIKDA